MAGNVGGIDSELTYFQAALKLYDLMDVTGALDNIGVKPSSNSSYDVSFRIVWWFLNKLELILMIVCSCPTYSRPSEFIHFWSAQ